MRSADAISLEFDTIELHPRNVADAISLEFDTIELQEQRGAALF